MPVAGVGLYHKNVFTSCISRDYTRPGTESNIIAISTAILCSEMPYGFVLSTLSH